MERRKCYLGLFAGHLTSTLFQRGRSPVAIRVIEILQVSMPPLFLLTIMKISYATAFITVTAKLAIVGRFASICDLNPRPPR